MRRAWSVAAALPRIDAIATATPVAYEQAPLHDAHRRELVLDRRGEEHHVAGDERYGDLRIRLSRRSTRPRAMRESSADWRPTESSLMEPALAAESASGPDRQGLRRRPVDDDARVGQERRRVGEVSMASGSLKSPRASARVYEYASASASRCSWSSRAATSLRSSDGTTITYAAAERAAHDYEQRERQRRCGCRPGGSSRRRDAARNRYPAPRTVRISSGSRGVPLDLLAQVPDVHVDRPRLAVVRTSAQPLEQLPRA